MRRIGLSRSSDVLLEGFGELAQRRPGLLQSGAIQCDFGVTEFVRFAHIAVRKKRVRQLPATQKVCQDLDEIES